MADIDYEDDQYVIVDLVDDSVVAGTDPPLALSADQRLGPARPWLIGEELDGRLDPPSSGRLELAQLAYPPPPPGDVSGHRQQWPTERRATSSVWGSRGLRVARA